MMVRGLPGGLGAERDAIELLFDELSQGVQAGVPAAF